MLTFKKKSDSISFLAKTVKLDKDEFNSKINFTIVDESDAPFIACNHTSKTVWLRRLAEHFNNNDIVKFSIKKTIKKKINFTGELRMCPRCGINHVTDFKKNYCNECDTYYDSLGWC